jgi:hypothetical protein
MAKVSEEAKGHYAEKLKRFKGHVESIKQKEAAVVVGIREGSGDIGMLKVSQVETVLELASYYSVMNLLSVSLLDMRNDALLNEARKVIYKAIILLESVVSSHVDAPFSEYEERLAALDAFGDAERYALVRKLGFAIDSVEAAFGDNSKWRWGFVEIEARFATIVKNLINFRTLAARLDPRHASYKVVASHVDLCRRLLQQAADRYREKYELSTLRFEDMKLAIEYLSALRRVHIMLGESDEADIVKKKVEVWKNKMEQDQRKAEENAKK